MTKTDDARRQQRTASFGAALARLDEACAQDTYTYLERAGLLRTFAFTYELGWKSLKDLLFHEGHNVNSPRAAVRKGFESGHINKDDCDTLLHAIGTRNTLDQAYEDELARKAATLIKNQYHPALRRLRSTLEPLSAE